MNNLKLTVRGSAALAALLAARRKQSVYGQEEDFIFASPTLDGKQPLWGQTLNADFVKPAAVALGFVREGERFGWHSFRHSLSTWAHETTKDITVSQTMLRHARPATTALYTHGNFEKALAAQRVYMARLLPEKPRRRPPSRAIGLGIGLEVERGRPNRARKWLWRKEKAVVGATGFEPVTSTV